MFVWAPIPAGFTDSLEFVKALFEKAGVLVTPGSAFGPSGEGHVRMALVQAWFHIKALIAIKPANLSRDLRNKLDHVIGYSKRG